MLLELSVKNFGIIDEITWKPAKGLNVITGETGAGKSLVVDAVEALLSGQIKTDDIRTGAEDAGIEAIFQLNGNGASEIRESLSEKGIQPEEDFLIVSCVFHRGSRTVPRINRQAVPIALLKETGTSLVDIHSQTGQISLLDKKHHLDLLDNYARTLNLRSEFSARASELHQADGELQKLNENKQDMSRQTELLDFQINEIKQAELKENEEDELESELVILTSGEKLKTASYEIYSIISNSERTFDLPSVLTGLNEAVSSLKKMVETDSSMRTQLERLENTVYELAELADEIRRYGENLDYSPQRLEEVQNRLELIRNLKRKYGNSVDEIMNYLSRAEQEREGLGFSEERQQKLAREIERLRNEMGDLASRLSGERIRAGEQLTAAVKKELNELGMEKVDFEISITRQDSDDGLPFPDGNNYRFSGSGVDIVEFLTSTNPGEPLKPLARIASTGETSRFMLAVKCALAESDTIPLLIFDEIDIGIGGRSGEIIGKKLRTLSLNHQVTCVTHLPQIAAFADNHYHVSKETDGDRTISRIEKLDAESRLNELAAMIGGPHFTQNSLNTAQELVQKAEKWKQHPD